MRTIESHKVNPANHALTVTVEDAEGVGGASHLYRIAGFNTSTNPSGSFFREHVVSATLLFQNGPIEKAGVNGITHEALIAILCDRLRGFQSGPYANDDNASALESLHMAQKFLQARTLKRMDRGVEGTHTV